jgi:glycosyltransferase involved in cell wall biosynthesis
MNQDTVSCVVPAYNAARFLAPALESIFSQTHPAHEIIVVDDGSTDETRAIASRFGGLVTIVETEHRGHLAARDAGVDAARGDYIAFLDADDLWAPGKNERQLDVLRQNPDLDLCVAHFQNFWDPEIADEEERYRDLPLSKPMSGYIVPTLMARRDVFTRFGRFNSGECPSDTGWFAGAIAMGARLETLPDVLLHRRLHRANDSRMEPSSMAGLFHLIKTRHRGTT